jgi:hypothetical protein
VSIIAWHNAANACRFIVAFALILAAAFLIFARIAMAHGFCVAVRHIEVHRDRVDGFVCGVYQFRSTVEVNLLLTHNLAGRRYEWDGGFVGTGIDCRKFPLVGSQLNPTDTRIDLGIMTFGHCLPDIESSSYYFDCQVIPLTLILILFSAFCFRSFVARRKAKLQRGFFVKRVEGSER